MVDFSIVILTFNSEKTIKKLLLNLLVCKQDLEIEIIIIDSGSKDNTVNIVRSFVNTYPNICFFKINQNKFSYAGTRNFAALKARGKYILYLSSDCHLDPQANFLNKIKAAFESERRVAAVFGRQEPFRRHLPYYRFELISLFRRLNELQNGSKKNLCQSKENLDQYRLKGEEFFLYFLSNVFACYKKIFLNRNKFFLPANINTGEDFIMGKTIIDKGYKKIYLNSIYVIHSHNFSPIQYYQREKDKLILCKLFHIRQLPNFNRFAILYHHFNLLEIISIIFSTPLFCIIKMLAYIRANIDLINIKKYAA